MKPKIVIGLIGTIGAGKDIASEYIVKNYGFKVIGMGDTIREEATNRSVEHTRENLVSIAREFSDKYGMDIWAKKVVSKILELGWEKVVINGVRRVPAIEVYRENFGNKFHLILIDADQRIRFERLKNRNRPGDPKSWEDFVEQEKNELKLYETFEESIKLADCTIKNESTLNNLYAKIDEVMKKIKSN